MKQIILASIATGSLLFNSCGDKKDNTESNEENGKSSGSAVAAADLNPVETVEHWKNSLTAGELATLWSALPESYQKDITGLAHNLGDNVDAELYNETMSTVGTLANVLKTKKGMILELLKGMAPKDKADDVKAIENSYDSVVGLLSSIVSSDAKDTDGLKKLDVAKFLGALQKDTKQLASLASLAGDDFKNLKESKTELVSETKDSAVVKFTMDGKNEENKLAKVDGRWVPAEMAEEWPEMIKEANKGIKEMGEMKPEQKQQMLGMLGMIKANAKSLESAKTKDEMMQKLGAVMQMFGGM